MDSSPSSNLHDPPPNSHKEKSPVLQKLRWLSLKSVSDELKNPAHHEQGHRYRPQASDEKRSRKQRDRKRYHRNSDGVAQAVDRVLVAFRIFRHPFCGSLVSKHRQSSRHEISFRFSLGSADKSWREEGYFSFVCIESTSPAGRRTKFTSSRRPARNQACSHCSPSSLRRFFT